MNPKVEDWMRKAAIDLCRELYDRFIMGGWEPQDAHDEAAQIIAEHAPEPQWISVEERLPEQSTPNLWCCFLTHMGTQKHTGILKYQSGHFWGADCMTREVTHWMPLPQGPEDVCPK